MDRSIARVGAWAGVIALVGIFGYHLALMAIAGQRVSGTIDAAAITAYYQEPAIALLSVEQFFVLIPMTVFAVALRESLATTPWTRFLATTALVAVTAEIGVLVATIATQAALVVTARSGGEIVGLFRFWDALYNSGAYALEATWVAAFGLAMRQVAVFPGLVTPVLLRDRDPACDQRQRDLGRDPGCGDAAIGVPARGLVRRGQSRTPSNGDCAGAGAGRPPGWDPVRM